jgi:hypothetical protein
MGETKSVASETDVPSGLDVVPMEPGTIVGSRDLQGTDGTTRTDRPGEILGTPVANQNRTDARAREGAKHDYVTTEVDRANREELPRLGGNIDDEWEPGAARTTDIAPNATRNTDSNIHVSSKTDKG